MDSEADSAAVSATNTPLLFPGAPGRLALPSATCIASAHAAFSPTFFSECSASFPTSVFLPPLCRNARCETITMPCWHRVSITFSRWRELRKPGPFVRTTETMMYGASWPAPIHADIEHLKWRRRR